MMMMFPFSQRSKNDPWFGHQIVRNSHTKLQKIVNNKSSMELVGLVGWLFFMSNSDTYLYTKCFVFISRMECVLSAAVELWKAATVNQRQSWVFQELNLFFLFLEVKSPSLLRILKKSSSSNTRQIEADNNKKKRDLEFAQK